MNVSLFTQSLSVLGKGMLGVFIVMAIIAIVITVLNKAGNKK